MALDVASETLLGQAGTSETGAILEIPTPALPG